MGSAYVSELDQFLSRLESDSSLVAPNQLRRRLDALDLLESRLPSEGLEHDSTDPIHAALQSRATQIRERLEEANAQLFQSIRFQIKAGTAPVANLARIRAL